MPGAHRRRHRARDPRIRPAALRRDSGVGQAAQELQQIRFLAGRQFEALHELALIGIRGSHPREWSAADGASSRPVMVDRVFESFHAAVVHVGRGEGDIPQRGRFEFSAVRRLPRELKKPRVIGRISQGRFQVIESRIVKLHLGRALSQIIHGAGEIKSPVAVETLQPLAEEKLFAPLRFG